MSEEYRIPDLAKASEISSAVFDVKCAWETLSFNSDKQRWHKLFRDECLVLRDRLLALFPIDDVMKREHAAREVIAKAQRIQASMLEIIEADTGDEIEKCEGCGVLIKGGVR